MTSIDLYNKATFLPIAKVFGAGLLISFLGSLPVGTLNITAFNISATQNLYQASYFSVGAILVELLMIRLILRPSKKINLSSKIFFYIFPLSVILLLYLSVNSFMRASAQISIQESMVSLPLIKSSFLLGLTLSFLNPMHIPFWLTWNSVLMDRNILQHKKGMIPSYIIGVGLGTALVLVLFIFLGRYIFQNFGSYNYVISLVMGILYLGFSAYILFLFYKKQLKKKFS